MNNKKTGTSFEREFAEILSSYGFWVHRLQDNHNGQPFDLIAARHGKPYTFDCKDCQGDKFLFRRMEENQRNAMDLWQECGNVNCFFAVHYPKAGLQMFEYTDLVDYEQQGMSYISQKDAYAYGYTFEEFMRMFVHEDINQQ